MSRNLLTVFIFFVSFCYSSCVFTTGVGCSTGCYLSATATCSLCPSQCSGCTSLTYCTSCADGYQLYENNCVQCSTNCLTCESSEKCITCKTSYYLTAEFACGSCSSTFGTSCVSCNTNGCSQCSYGYFLNLSGSCEICSSKFGASCLTCNSTSCLECSSTYILYNGKCYKQADYCYEKYPGCSTCNSNSCSACLNGGYLQGDGTCPPCSLKSCTECLDGYYCSVCSTTNGYCYDSMFYECKPHDLYNCSSDSYDCTFGQCTYCKNGYATKDSLCYACYDIFPHCSSCSSTTCLGCQETYFLSSTKQCVQCENCGEAGCSTDGSVCYDCIGNYVIRPNGKCVLYSTVHCTSAVSGRCTSCENGYYLAGGSCFLVQTCSASTANFTNGICVTQQTDVCSSSSFKLEGLCVTCAQYYDNCTKCSTILTNSFCSVCAVGYYPSGTKCETCASMGCATCSNMVYLPDSTNNKTCYSCLTGYYLDGKQCSQIKNCLIIDGNKCSKCSDNFVLKSNGLCEHYSTAVVGCLSASNNYCTSCSSSYYLEPTTHLCEQCVLTQCSICYSSSVCSQCYSPYTLNGGNCVTCSFTGCLTCSQTSYECTKCSSGYYLKTTLCEQCSTTFPYCGQCDSTHCTSCSLNYYLDPTEGCKLCTTLPGCSQCSQTSKTCTVCSSLQYYLLSGECKTCSTTLPYCKLCSSPSTCIECNSGFYLEGSSCYSCNTITGCATCNSTKKQCFTCSSDYKQEVDADGNVICKDCATVQSKCLVCDSSFKCSQCESGYTRSNLGTCLSCTLSFSNCATCSQTTYNCSQCTTKQYYVNSTTGTCQSCLEQTGKCVTCDSPSICLSCSAGYFLSSSQCYLCSTLPNCVSCSQDGKCTVCSSSYTPTITGCKTCAEVIENCTSCSTSNNTCYSCKAGSYLLNGKCSSCSAGDSHCLTCSSASSCSLCEDGYYLKSGKCYLCSSINGCILCSSSQDGCITCEGNDPAVDGKCSTCADSFCDVCSNYNVCDGCVQGYYLSPSTGCTPCSSMEGCSICSKTSEQCEQCQSYYFKNALNKCSECGSNCLTCSSATQCTKCEEGNVLKNDGSCGICSETIVGCSICSQTSNACEACYSNYYLNNNVCTPCSTINENCTTCSYVLDEATCTECSGNNVVSSGNCVPCAVDEYKENGQCKKCSSTVIGCGFCELVDSTFTCKWCETGYAFSGIGVCSLCSKAIDENGFCINCLEPTCSLCLNSTFCIKCQSTNYVLRQGKCTLSSNTNCITQTNSVGCEECRNSISLTGFCSAQTRTKDCSYYYKVGPTDETCVYYYNTKGMKQADLLTCKNTNYGFCIDCGPSGNRYNYANPPQCLSCEASCLNCTSSYCHQCQTNSYIKDGVCSEDVNCVKKLLDKCISCVTGYYLDNNHCSKCSSFCSRCIKTSTSSRCVLCDSGYVLINRECQPQESSNCVERETTRSLCVKCANGYYLNSTGGCMEHTITDCKYSSDNVNCLQCSTDIVLTKDSKNEMVCGTDKPNYCSFANQFGCLRCIKGYYLDQKECLKCDLNCNTCSETSTKCTTCNFGYTLDLSNNCNFIGEQVEKCKTFLPNAQGCAVCNDGYYWEDKACYECDESCATCAINKTLCTSCNVTGGYFFDNNLKTCQHVSLLTNCIEVTISGCSKCENGYYVDDQYCSECLEGCLTCSKWFECDSCPKEYILKYESNSIYKTCVHYSQIQYCTSEANNKCGSCEGSFEVSTDGIECLENINYFVKVGIPIIVVLITIAVIMITGGVLAFYLAKRHKKNEQRKKVCEFEIKRSNIEFSEINEECGLLVNKNELNFQFDFEDETLIPVNRETRDIICIGNSKCHLMKVQLSIKDDTEKYSLRTNPQLISLKKGKACEFEVYITPFCTCVIDEFIAITCLDLKNGINYHSRIKIRAETEITTRLDPIELIEERKLGEGSFGIVYLGTFRGNKVAIKKMKQLNDSDVEKGMKEFEKEVDMLDKFRSEYIVHFYGAVFIPNKICMVTEFAQYGSCSDLMKKRKTEPIEMKLRIKMMIDAAKGISYLHSNGILHRDIKPDNILVVSLDKNYSVNAKLTDFGSSRNINLLMTNMTFTKGIGTPIYMAPEILDKKHYKMPSDIYSFAISLFEFIKWDDPYPKELFKFPWTIATAVVEGTRPNIDNFEPNIRGIIEMCWDQNVKTRITSPLIVKLLGDYIKNIDDNGVFTPVNGTNEDKEMNQ